MASRKIHIGTSGWNYKHWKGPFYPEDLNSGEWLEFYAKKFRTVEINNSFYHLPSKRTFDKWKKTTPKNFLFAVKASRYITHNKKLKDPKSSLKKFLVRIKGLGAKCGPVLFQLPPHWKFNRDRLEEFLDALPKGHRYTIEFRNDSWWNDETYELLAARNAAFCIFELGGRQSPKEVTADFVYLRLHGPGKKYQGNYSKQNFAGWRGAFDAWRKKRKEIYCYFDNDDSGYAAKNALALQDML